jgi:quercetin dioxygenase-like cupin family protein
MDRSPDDLEWACADFAAALDLLRGLGMQLEVIFPADDPHTAVLTHDGLRLRLTRGEAGRGGAGELPPFLPEFVITPAGSPSTEGRAGMRYRDLIPSRLGGRYIASQISIPGGGPVADWVHFHRLALQLIYVRRGWVRVVYEDQGEPFVMSEGDLVLQPPGIRHRVLESSPSQEVVEISCPALHETVADRDMELPNVPGDPPLTFGEQHFLHHVAADAPWLPWHGAEMQPTGVHEASGGLADVRTLRPGASPIIDVLPHDGELVFGFVLEGTANLEHAGTHPLGPADAFVIPPGLAWRLTGASVDVRVLPVTPGALHRR